MKIKKFDILYLFVGLIFIFFLVRSWLPSGYIIAGHDSGLALDAGNFLKTRFFAWDEQGFGSDNSAHFGSIVIHGIDYLTSLLANSSSAGNYLNVFCLSAIKKYRFFRIFIADNNNCFGLKFSWSSLIKSILSEVIMAVNGNSDFFSKYSRSLIRWDVPIKFKRGISK